MDPVIGGALIGGASQLLGGILGQSSARKAQHQQNLWNLALYREAREWDKGLADTEVQRRVNDLKNAGLNPMLAAGDGASSGSPAPIPMSAQGGIEGAKMKAQGVANAVNSGLSAVAQKVQIQQAMKNVELTEANTDQVKAQTRNTLFSADQIKAQTEKTKEEIFRTRQEIANLIQAWRIGDVDERLRRLSAAQQEELNPLVLKAQALAVKARELQIPGLENLAEFEKTLGGDVKPWVQFIRALIGGISSPRWE